MQISLFCEQKCNKLAIFRFLVYIKQQNMNIAENIQRVKKEIHDAALACGRKPADIQLIAVSKTYPIEDVAAAAKTGQLAFGENRPQEMTEKHAILPDLQWHLIGQLQRNKVKYIAPFVALIHSIDSEELLAEVNRQAAKHERTINVLLQINISQESQKSGMEGEEAFSLLENIKKYPNICVCGLMGIATFTEDEALIRAQFRTLAKTLENLKNTFSHKQIVLKELSMGMSGDYEIAIQEGATMIRVGTAIFGAR